MMHIDDFSLYFQRVPYLSIEKASAQRVEFLFRGAAGRAQRCALGAVFALAFPCNSGRGGQADNPPPAQIQQAHRLSLLLASSAFALDLGLQHEGCFWLLWKRFDPEAVQTPDAVFAALDNMVYIMRFLYHRCFKVSRRSSHRNMRHTSQAAQFA
ncbi:hypothetical protein [Candidatus Glomeribacter gigasporarum]|uniref:hypothetical protein n=1 Tax=Candidatus Glomeribacter gigasporarum TaxID=132144 RepID=UPI000312E021|nr:hypothetical protein [Candidatus Glomeribacter gigasporarum]